MYPGGKVEYGSQAIAIAKRECHTMINDDGVYFFQWHGWLDNQYWHAGFNDSDGHCMIMIDPRSGKTVESVAGSSGF